MALWVEGHQREAQLLLLLLVLAVRRKAVRVSMGPGHRTAARVFVELEHQRGVRL